MELENHYNSLYRESLSKIKSKEYGIDKLISSPNDKRYGMTLLIRPTLEIKEKISFFLREMIKVDPNQYYYPESDMHITVLSIISCYSGFDFSKINSFEYIMKIRDAIENISSFNISFSGITASPSCIMIQGYPQDDIINTIRNNIRILFRNSSLENSIDTRYKLRTTHSTVIRFKEKLTHVDKYLERLEAFRKYSFGTFKVDSLELVLNDWYQRDINSVKLNDFNLSPQKSKFKRE